ncbi:LptA/OstA family protein [Roseinatronobacter sp. NSM]|uniref:LptA/OstA family protein n=1 Tax=Roseinatronobacter sp. NSM TaxID=3457785 RepID=UPI004036EEC7
MHTRNSMAFALGLGLVVLAPLQVLAQGTGLNFSGLQNVRGLPVEIRADNLQVNNQTGETVFSGNAVLGQGDMRLAAPEIIIIYAAAGDGTIERLEASGGVTLVTADEAAEAQTAIYDVAAATVRMRGAVLLTQGQNVLSGDSLFVDLRTEQGRMEGGVRTLIQTNP